MSFYKYFMAGIFWINCQLPEIIQYSIETIEKVRYNECNMLNMCKRISYEKDLIKCVCTCMCMVSVHTYEIKV